MGNAKERNIFQGFKNGEMRESEKKAFYVRRSLLERVSIFRRFFRLLWDRILACSTCKASMRYRRLSHSCPSFDNPSALVDNHRVSSDVHTDHDLVTLKVSLLGDCRIGKTSFMIKYVGDVEEQRCLQMSGLNLMDKIFFVKGARIAFSIWDVGDTIDKQYRTCFLESSN
ncbi:hypothetical protein QJS04_geneDACA018188 [Acorus gramineus]|uniref:Uncharacterized protein n=1 Tax=Acorus gramineus TaxID=55184 RepID=A0AAV9BUR8_ACOGR|nr:hypothetical protein QJS04_geneDACA018188 [Acorus gramineus]